MWEVSVLQQEGEAVDPALGDFSGARSLSVCREPNYNQQQRSLPPTLPSTSWEWRFDNDTALALHSPWAVCRAQAQRSQCEVLTWHIWDFFNKSRPRGRVHASRLCGDTSQKEWCTDELSLSPHAGT